MAEIDRDRAKNGRRRPTSVEIAPKLAQIGQNGLKAHEGVRSFAPKLPQIEQTWWTSPELPEFGDSVGQSTRIFTGPATQNDCVFPKRFLNSPEIGRNRPKSPRTSPDIGRNRCKIGRRRPTLIGQDCPRLDKMARFLPTSRNLAGCGQTFTDELRNCR